MQETDLKQQVKKYLHQRAQRQQQQRFDHPHIVDSDAQRTLSYEPIRRVPDPKLVQILKNLINGGAVLQRQIADAVNISQTKMSQFLKGAERKRGWKTLERNLYQWVSTSKTAYNYKATTAVSAGKIDCEVASPKLANIYQIQQESSSESKSNDSSDESREEVDESLNTSTSPHSPVSNPGYNVWTNENQYSPTDLMHDSIRGMNPSNDFSHFHSWDSFSINSVFP